MSEPNIVDVILPVPFGETFSYILPSNWSVRSGCRVVVPFGARKHVTGIIVGVNQKPNPDFSLKEITEVLDVVPIVSVLDIKFWRWIADYYMCSLGEVMHAALPGGLMVESNSIVILNEDYNGGVRFEGAEAKIFEWISANKKGELKTISKALGIKNTFKALKSLLDCSAIFLDDNIKHKYRAKTEVFVSLATLFNDDEVLNAFINGLKRAPKQEELLMLYFQLREDNGDAYIPRHLLTKAGNYATYKSLLKKQVFVEHEVEVSRLEELIPLTKTHALTSWQNEALTNIKQQFEEKSVVLLKGASASGKTEIYIHLIQEQISQGKQVLFLVPEISLTTQLSKRLKRVFGSGLAIFHSKYDYNKRTELWKTASVESNVSIVLGARSALFIPFKNLGLIIIDEEHERSLKQQEPSPRYHAKDSAIMLAEMNNAKVLLGSATPSIESLYNAKSNKFGFVELTKRFGNSIEPAIQIIDMHAAYKKRKLKHHFSFELLDEIKSTLDDNKQVIIFHNRRGYAPVVECKACAWVQKCHQCDVAMTWHIGKQSMSCHYCGSKRSVSNICNNCGEETLINKGFGTEKVEDELREFFPDASIERFDADTTSGVRKMEKLLDDFEEGNTDILIGTQMISRGLDFDNVGLVGVLNADNLFNFPEFRASERAWQMLTQVAGRAGRRETQGSVIIQTHNPEHPVIKALTSNNVAQFVSDELEEREAFRYPPFNRLIDISLRHTDKQVLHRSAQTYASKIRSYLGGRVLGPEVPGINRIKGSYIEKILIKSENRNELKWIKEVLFDVLQRSKAAKEMPQAVRFNFDVDPH